MASQSPPQSLPSYTVTVTQLSIRLSYLHHSETFEPVPPFWALDCHCMDRIMFCLLPSLQYRVSKKQKNARIFRTNWSLWLGTLLALQLPRPEIFFFLPYWTLLCFLLHSQALEHQGEAGTCPYSPPSSVYIIPGKKDQHTGYSVIRKIFTFVNKLPTLKIFFKVKVSNQWHLKTWTRNI